MLRPVYMMYMRPGNLEKEFIVERKIETVNEYGRAMEHYKQGKEPVSGILVVATQNQGEQNQYRWNQEQHSLTHTIVAAGSPVANKGDKLIHEDRVFEVLTADNIGELGISTIYYVEERNDLR